MNRPLVPEDIRQVSAAAVLGWVARAHAVAAKSYHEKAAHWLADSRAPVAAQRIFEKAAVGAGNTGDLGGQRNLSIGQWSDSARTTSAFYRIWSDGAFIKVPPGRRVGMITSAATGAVVGEGRAVPVSKTVIGNVQLVPQKVGALVVVTDELLLEASAEAAFNRELMSAISAAVDAAFLDKIDTGLTPITSSSPLGDLRSAMTAVTGGSLARPYWVASTDVGKLASTLGTTKGGSATAAASMVGGELANLPLLISSGCPAGTLYLIDAAQIAADAVAPEVEVSTQADVLMDSAPSGMNSDVPSGAAMTSMFMTNSTALLATAIFAAEKLRSTAVSVVSGIDATKWAAT